MATAGQPALTVWPLACYGFGTKPAPDAPRDRSEGARLARLQAKYALQGTRRSVAAILLAHEHRHPHALLLADAAAPPTGGPPPRLPGGRLRPGEDELAGLRRKLTALLSPPPPPGAPPPAWDVRECAGCLVRPGFTPDLYPYSPPHVTSPKEVVRVFAVALPARAAFAVAGHVRLVAVPLMDLFAGGAAAWGAAAGAVPLFVSRFRLALSTPPPRVVAPPPPPAGPEFGPPKPAVVAAAAAGDAPLAIEGAASEGEGGESAEGGGSEGGDDGDAAA